MNRGIKIIINSPKYIIGLFGICIIRLVDLLLPKSRDIWVFPVHFFIHTFSDNCRAVYEAVKDDRTITKIILTRGKKIDFSHDDKTIILPMASLRALWFILRAKVIFVQHSLIFDFNPIFKHSSISLLNLSLRKVINLWHGIIIKRVGVYTRVNNLDKGTIRSRTERRVIKARKREQRHYMISASSFNNKITMSDAFYPVKPQNVIVTGYPRNDFLVKDESFLPSYCVEQLNYISKSIGNKKLIIYAPTYRELKLGGKNYEFSEQEIHKLKELLDKHNAIMGFRLHYHNRSMSFDKLIDNEYFVDLDQKYIPDMEMIIRKAHIIISDYSCLFVDTMYINKPIICFAYDYEHYDKVCNGFVYPLELINPFPICTSFADVESCLIKILNDDWKENQERLEQISKLFFECKDANNSTRLVNYIKNHY